MKRVIFSAAALFAVVACTEAELSEATVEDVDLSGAIVVNASMSSSADSRVEITDEWVVNWEDGDALLGYSQGAGEFTKFSMTEFEATASSFSGGVAANSYYLIYPYSEVTAADSYTVDLSSQFAGLNNTHMISSSEVSSESSSVTMTHIGAMMTLAIGGCDTYAGYKLKAVELTSVPTTATIDLTDEIVIAEGAKTYGSLNSGANMLVIAPEPVTIVAGTAPELQFNILPFNVSAGNTLTVNVQLVDEDGKDWYAQASVTNSGETNVAFNRATYNSVKVTIDESTFAEGCKMSMITADNVPEGTTWTINDSGSGEVSSADDYLGQAKYQNLRTIIPTMDEGISLVFPNLTGMAGSALFAGDTSVYCTNLVSVSAPKVTYLGFTVFKNCSDLVSASFPSLEVLSNNVFQYSGVTDLEIATAEGSYLTTITSNSFGTASKINLVLGRHNEDIVDNKTITVGEISTTFNSIVDENGDSFVAEEDEWQLPEGAVLLSSFDGTTATQPEGDTWTIYVGGETVDFTGLNTLIKLLTKGDSSSQTISLIFPDLTSFPVSAFEGTDGKTVSYLKSISAPYVTTINNKTFKWIAVDTLELASAPGVALSSIGAADAFGYSATMSVTNLILGTANRDYVDTESGVLTWGEKTYTFASITLQDNSTY